MKIALFAYSRQGCRTARRVMRFFENEELSAFTMERFAESGFSPIPRPSRSFYGTLFSESDAMIFVGSCGIAVREIAPHVKDKRTDPAVISLDELGRFVIPLLSGHIGGANRLAAELAAALGSTAVITTATDIHQKFSVDAWAARQGFHISSMLRAKEISAAILEEPVGLCSDLPIVSDLPNGVVMADSGKIGIYIGWQKKEPFEKTLRLVPPILHLGIGCKRNTPSEAIAEAVSLVLDRYKMDAHGVECVASVDLKSNEEGLLAYCREMQWPLSFYSADDLMSVSGDFTSSAFVKGVVGVDNVCERAALLGADRLVVKKTAHNGVTVAVAEKCMEVCFG